MKYKVDVQVSLKKSILDPQGKTVNNSLKHLGYIGVEKLRIGKFITFECEGASKNEVKTKVEEISNKILINPIMETYTYTMEEI